MKPFIVLFAAVFCLSAAWWIFANPTGPTLIFEAVRDSMRKESNNAPVQDSVFFLGDIMLARDVENRLKVQAPEYAFEELPMLKEAKWVVGNFEASVPVTHVPAPNMTMRFSVEPTLLPVLEIGGLTHLSLANNHALDYFEEGYLNSLAQLKARGFEVFGHPLRVDENSISYLEADGRKIALIGINATYGEVPTTWMDSLAEASLLSDTQIVYIHWGDEYDLFHNEDQEELAHIFIDAGFDVVIGHHPHVVQNIERYRDGIIFYSLGNFIFDQYWNKDVSEGLMLELVVERESMAFVLHPIESRTTKVRPRLMSDIEKTAFLEDLALRSSRTLEEGIRQGVLALQF